MGLSSSEGPNPSYRCFVLFLKSLISPCTKKTKPMHHVVSCGDMQRTPPPNANKSPGRAAHLYRELEIYFIPRGLHLSTKRRIKRKKQKNSLSFASEISGSASGPQPLSIWAGLGSPAEGQSGAKLCSVSPRVPTSVLAMSDE